MSVDTVSRQSIVHAGLRKRMIRSAVQSGRSAAKACPAKRTLSCSIFANTCSTPPRVCPWGDAEPGVQFKHGHRQLLVERGTVSLAVIE